MKKTILTLGSVGIILGAIVGFALSYFLGKSVDMVIEDTFCGLEWGSDKIVVEATLEREGYKNISEDSSTFSIFSAENYDGINGANGYIVCHFNKKGQLEIIMLTFKTESDSAKTSKTTSGNTINAIIETCTNQLEKNNKITITDNEYSEKAGESYVDSGIEFIYSLGEKSIITIMYVESEKVSIVYESIKSEFAQQIKKLYD